MLSRLGSDCKKRIGGIDFASLVFYCVGSAITKQGGCALYRIDAVASLYCVFPWESSAMCNKKAVLRTAPFIIRVTICEQAPIVTLTTKATLASGSLVAHCARDSGGIRTHDPQLRRLLLYPTELRNQPRSPYWLNGCAKVIYFFQLHYILSTIFRIKSNNRRLGRWFIFHSLSLFILSGMVLSSSATR